MIRACHMDNKTHSLSIMTGVFAFMVTFLLQKYKFMQPTDYNEALVNSAERCNKRRRRIQATEKWKQNTTPVRSPYVVLAADTQQVSPVGEAISLYVLNQVEITCCHIRSSKLSDHYLIECQCKDTGCVR